MSTVQFHDDLSRPNLTLCEELKMADKLDDIEGGGNHSYHLEDPHMPKKISNQFEETNAKDGGVEGEATDRGEARLLIAHGFCQISLKRRSKNSLT